MAGSRGSIWLTGNAPGNFVGSSSFVGSGVGFSQQWAGGRSAVVVNASAYATSPGLHLRIQGPGGSWIPVCSSFLSDQVFMFDAAPGNYRIQNDGSSSIGVSAALVGIPYNL